MTRIAIVAPRNMCFSPRGATSIDLHIHETVRWSRYRDAITVFAEEVGDPFTDVPVRFWKRDGGIASIRALLAGHDPTLVVVHQHLPTASALARDLDAPVVLVRHNFQKRPRNAVQRFFKRRQIGRLAGIAFVSECCRADFEESWPEFSRPTRLLPNGIDSEVWRPAPEKEKIVLFVGRMAPEKGALEAARAMTQALDGNPGWQGVFITVGAPEHPDYARQVSEALGRAGDRITRLSDIPHAEVCRWMGRAAISLAPTQNREPFGRVAVEALACGAVLIASAQGGFVEIVGDAGVLLEDPSAENIASALARLIGDDKERARLSAEGRARVTPRYDLSSTVAAFDSFAERFVPAQS